MQFLYKDNNQGVFSSLWGSWIVWLVIILLLILIIIMVIRSSRRVQELLHIDGYFDPDQKNEKEKNSDATMNNIHETLIKQINSENLKDISRRSTLPDEIIPTDRQYEPDLKKTLLHDDLDESLIENALLIGDVEEANENKHVKTFYSISSKKESLYSVFNTDKNRVNFKVEYKDLSKIPINYLAQESVLRLYGENKKCLVVFTFEPQKIYIRSASPYASDTILNIDENVRLIAFTQVDNKLFAHDKHIATISNYDKIKYFYVHSPIIKELQYF